ncbi:MAG: hypothetical protein PHW60_03305 [Kiritimatiellae bacterium]|nr:hypothetical protein [Kiritimatiellia bacterium]
MSDDFDALEYLKTHPDWFKKPVLIGMNQNKDSEDDSIQARADRFLRRHRPVINIQPPITIRQFRHIEVPNNWLPSGKVNQRQNTASSIVLKAVRPYARRSRTSSYWEDSGWEHRGTNLIGYYKAGDNSYRGAVELTDSSYRPMKFYIYDPPSVILDGPHGACYHWQGLSGLNKYWIHFSEGPANIDSGIIQIERSLSEALGVE